MPDLHLNLLDAIEIASPCSARWEDMSGDDRTRFCSECSLHVHNISDMTRPEAEAFLRTWVDSADGSGEMPRLCARLFRRADGTIITRDCPAGIAAIRARARRAALRLCAALGLAGLATAAAAGQRASPFGRLRGVQPFAYIAEKLSPCAPAPPPMMGRMCTAGAVGITQPTPNAAGASGSNPPAGGGSNSAD